MVMQYAGQNRSIPTAHAPETDSAAECELDPGWEVVRGDGPVLATALHQGHGMRDELRPYLAVSGDERRRDEDPITGYWASAGDNIFRSNRSRFEVDLNRPRVLALSTDPKHTWGRKIWRAQPPRAVVDTALRQHDAFYAFMDQWIDELIATHGAVLILDIHSYNHRREGPQSGAAPLANNPDLDIGATTVDKHRFGTVVDTLKHSLLSSPVHGRRLDVRTNVRYPDGGHFPEWVYSRFNHWACTITLEFKKFYMDEWHGDVSLPIVDDILRSLETAVHDTKPELAKCS